MSVSPSASTNSKSSSRKTGTPRIEDDSGIVEDMKFSQLWEERSRPSSSYRTKHPVRALASFIVLSALIGGLSALSLAPVTTASGAVAKSAPSVWDAIDADTSSFDDIVAPQPVSVVDADGDVLAKFYAESRIQLEYDDIGDNVVNALVDTEDSRFWTHSGIDDTGIARSLVSTLSGGQKQGASTITMQLVQNLRQVEASYSDDDAAFARAQADTMIGKVQEMKYALEFEKKHSKKEIITSYLNTVYFGNGYYGVGAAAQGYFSKDAADLSVPEAAVIAGLVQNPSGYDPVSNPEDAVTRRNQVIDRMVAMGDVEEGDGDKMKEEPLSLSVNPKPVGNNGCADSAYPYYCELVKNELLSSTALGADESVRSQRFYAGGFTVKTALDKTVVAALDDAAKNFKSSPYQTGLAEVQPSTGLIQGISQSTSFDETQVIYATSKLQTGSLFKPITIAAAVDNGVNPNVSFNVTDGYVSPTLDSPPGGFKNAEYTAGNMDLRTAVKFSNNIFFVKLLERVGVRNTAETARALGLSSVPSDLTGREGSLTLGAYEASPLQMASAFATFANGGVRCEPHAITAIGDKKIDNDCERVVSAKAAATVNSVLTAPLESGGTADTLSFTADVRVKSGSTDDYSVVWLGAYTPAGTIAGWVADPENPNGNPVRNVNVYGTVHGTGHGGDTAGAVVARAFNGSGIPSATYPSATSSGDIVHKDSNPPEVKGLTAKSAISALTATGRKVKVRNVGDGDDVATSWDEDDGILSVTGNADINGFSYYLDQNGNYKQEKPES